MIEPKNITNADALYLHDDDYDMIEMQGLEDEYVAVTRIGQYDIDGEYFTDQIILKRLSDKTLWAFYPTFTDDLGFINDQECSAEQVKAQEVTKVVYNKI